MNDSFMRAADQRGDSPLHAAACNGALACLRMLLEYGVEPDVMNKAGLRPIDLAVRRNHEDCEKLLSEYHLHHNLQVPPSLPLILSSGRCDALVTKKTQFIH